MKVYRHFYIRVWSDPIGERMENHLFAEQFRGGRYIEMENNTEERSCY